jgi:hypothetical protein
VYQALQHSWTLSTPGEFYAFNLLETSTPDRDYCWRVRDARQGSATTSPRDVGESPFSRNASEFFPRETPSLLITRSLGEEGTFFFPPFPMWRSSYVHASAEHIRLLQQLPVPGTFMPGMTSSRRAAWQPACLQYADLCLLFISMSGEERRQPS